MIRGQWWCSLRSSRDGRSAGGRRGGSPCLTIFALLSTLWWRTYVRNASTGGSCLAHSEPRAGIPAPSTRAAGRTRIGELQRAGVEASASWSELSFDEEGLADGPECPFCHHPATVRVNEVTRPDSPGKLYKWRCPSCGRAHVAQDPPTCHSGSRTRDRAKVRAKVGV